MWSVSVRRCSVSGRMFAAGIYKQDVYIAKNGYGIPLKCCHDQVIG